MSKYLLHEWSVQFSPIMQLKFPLNTQHLSMGLVNGRLCFWVVHSENPETIDVEIRALPNLSEPPPKGFYIGTQVVDGIVWHLFQILDVEKMMKERSQSDQLIQNLPVNSRAI